MLRIASLFSLVMTVQLSAAAQSGESADVMQPIRTFFDGMAKADTNLIRSSLHSQVRFQTVRRNGQVANEDMGGFFKQIAQTKPGELDERLGTPTISVDSPLAQVSTPYTFYYKGQYSHGGTNFFTVALEGGQYKILYVVDTRKVDEAKKKSATSPKSSGAF